MTPSAPAPGENPGQLSPEQVFFDLFAELLLYAGEPSSRELANLSNHQVSHTTVNAALRGPMVPTGRVYYILAPILHRLAGEDLPEHLSLIRLRAAWVAARKATRPTSPTRPAGRHRAPAHPEHQDQRPQDEPRPESRLDTEPAPEPQPPDEPQSRAGSGLVTDPQRLAQINADSAAMIDNYFQANHELALAQIRVETVMANELADRHVQNTAEHAATQDHGERPQRWLADEPAEEPPLSVHDMRQINYSHAVHIITGRPRYHLEDCPHLAGKTSTPQLIAEVRLHGYTPCALCRPNTTLLNTAARPHPNPEPPGPLPYPRTGRTPTRRTPPAADLTPTFNTWYRNPLGSQEDNNLDG